MSCGLERLFDRKAELQTLEPLDNAVIDTQRQTGVAVQISAIMSLERVLGAVVTIAGPNH
jgi:hypothetical protein